MTGLISNRYVKGVNGVTESFYKMSARQVVDGSSVAFVSSVRFCRAGCVGRIATYCQAQQFAHTQEPPKSICGTESGRTIIRAVKSPRSAERRTAARSRARGHARATAKFDFLANGGIWWIDLNCASISPVERPAPYAKEPARDLCKRRSTR